MKENQERELIEFLEAHKSATIDEIAAALYVSPSTARRRLKSLQAKGLVKRTHGGAQIDDEKNYLPSFSFRTHSNSLEKKKMALAAIKLIKNGDVVFLDGSTSSYYVAEYLANFENLKVFTNGIDTLSLLSKYKINAYSTGGKVSDENRSVLVGHYAENTLLNLHADVAFLSARSVNDQGEVYDCFEQEIALRLAMLRNATRRVLLCDSTKLDTSSPFKLGSVNDFDYFVCDKPTDGYFKTPVRAQILHP